MVIAVAAVLLALVGLAISLYFTLVYYGRLRPDSPLVPSVADPEQGACRTILETPWAHVFGLPNSLLGMGYYAIVMVASAIRLAMGTWPLLPVLIALAAAAALFSVYLAWSLIYRVRVLCPLCFTAQGINLVMLVLLLAAV